MRNLSVKILLLFIASAPIAHAYDYQSECIEQRASFQNQLVQAEARYDKTAKQLLDSNTPWRAVFYTEVEKEKLQSLADAKRFLFMMESNSTSEALDRTLALQKSIEVSGSKLERIITLGKREYDALKKRLVAEKIEVEILQGLQEDCENAPKVYDAAYQSAYLGNAQNNKMRRKDLVAHLQFHSLEKLDLAVAKAEQDRFNEPSNETIIVSSNF